MTFIAIDGGHGLLPDLSVELDVTNDPTNPVRVWTDVTPKLRQLDFTRSGRNDELQRTSTGSLSAVIDNRSSAVTALGIRKRQWIRVQARWAGVTYARWQGIIGQLPRQWPSAGKDDLIQLRADDALKVFKLYDLADQTFSAQRNDQRVSALATLVGISTSSIDTDSDAADAVASPIGEGTDALSMLLDIEASENGLVVAEPDGRLSFQGRHWRMLHSASPVAVFGETAARIPYRDTVVRDDDDTRIANIVAVTPLGGVAQIAADATSQAKYWKQRLNRALLTSSAAVATDASNYLLGRYKDPSARIPAIEVQLVAVPDALKPALLAAGNSTRFGFERAASTPISEEDYVEQISESITPGVGWTIKMQLSPAGDESGWVLGDAVNGVLGTTTRLVY